MTATPVSLTIDDVRQAHARIKTRINRTPIMTSQTFDETLGAKLYFKCENFQKSGAFKARGATNAVFSLSDEEAKNGVATHSSGNHAAALARAAQLRGVRAQIVMPRGASEAKFANVRRYGGEIILCEPTVADREKTAARIVAESGAVLIHPYNNLMVMAGQGTAALELLEDQPDLDLIVVPTSGGGLLTGTAVVAKALKPWMRVIAAEPEGADDAQRSFRSGKIEPMDNPRTIADGLRSTLGTLTFPIIKALVDDVATVSEPGIIMAMRSIWEILKIVVEPSGAVPLGVIQEGKVHVKGLRVGVILSGGNLDLDSLPWGKP